MVPFKVALQVLLYLVIVTLKKTVHSRLASFQGRPPIKMVATRTWGFTSVWKILLVISLFNTYYFCRFFFVDFSVSFGFTTLVSLTGSCTEDDRAFSKKLLTGFKEKLHTVDLVDNTQSSFPFKIRTSSYPSEYFRKTRACWSKKDWSERRKYFSSRAYAFVSSVSV